jgi:hypothetical protein
MQGYGQVFVAELSKFPGEPSKMGGKGDCYVQRLILFYCHFPKYHLEKIDSCRAFFLHTNRIRADQT